MIMKKLKTITGQVVLHLFDFIFYQNENYEEHTEKDRSTTIQNFKHLATLLISYILINIFFMFFLKLG